MVVQNKTGGRYTIHDLNLVLEKGQVVNLTTYITASTRRSKDLRYAIEKGHVVVLNRASPYVSSVASPYVSSVLRHAVPLVGLVSAEDSIRKVVLVSTVGEQKPVKATSGVKK